MKESQKTINDELFGFGSAIKSLYLKDYDEICKFGQIVSSQITTVTATFNEREFPQFFSKLDRYRSIGGRSELILDWKDRNNPVAQISNHVDGPKGAFLPNQWGFVLIDIGQHRFIFVSWNKDRKTVRVFWNGKSAGTFKHLSFWQNFIGGSFDLLDAEGQIVASFTFPNLLASMGNGPSWTKIRIQFPIENIKLSFPNQWPSPGGGISEELVSNFSNVPFEKQIISIAVLLWSNNSI